jgi:hypothetical protein
MTVCWECGGDGGFHDCGDDTCCCLEPTDVECESCGGTGEVLEVDTELLDDDGVWVDTGVPARLGQSKAQ